MNDFKGYLLVVEDEPAVQSNNTKILQRRGYNIRQAYTLAEARMIIAKEPPMGIILDLLLPDGNGLDFLRELRKTSDIPVLILTAMGTTEDIIQGFEAGGDDYLTKPYELSVFLTRVEALLRRAASVPDTLEFGSMKLFTASGRVIIDDEEIALTQKEYSILQLLVQHPKKVLSAEYLYSMVWGHEITESDNSLKVAISKLRTKLVDTGYTVTASRGEGYYIERTANKD